MEYGCIGEHLSHSFSGEIHARLASYSYELCEIPREGLDAFMRRRDFRAINVTIPYKEAVIPYLDEISPEARAIGAVNAIVHRDGRLYGYNTDFYGIVAALGRMGFEDLAGKTVLVLGTGGTSKTARAVAHHLGASVYRVSRTAREDAISYEDAVRLHSDASLIINTTPVGMYPSVEGVPIELSRFSCLEGVFDAVYNPLRTRLILEARALGIPAEGGLYMLVAQAFRAVEIFLDATLDPALLETTYQSVLKEKESIVLIGMPASGKSTLGERIARHLLRPFLDADAVLSEREGRKIPDIFKAEGEAFFRDRESETLASLALQNGIVLATGGGAILREENVRRLRQNGRLVFLDRSPEQLIPTADRPTASDREAMLARYRERYALYLQASDVRIPADGSADEVFDIIRKELTL